MLFLSVTDAQQYKLVIEDPEGRRNVVEVQLGAVSIGRLLGNAIQLDERNVSREHARLVRRDDGVLYAEDLQSYNGLYLNGTRIEGRQVIREGDVLRVGDFHLELRGEASNTDERSLRQETTNPAIPRPPTEAEEPTQPRIVALPQSPSDESAGATVETKPNINVDKMDPPPKRADPTAVIRISNLQERLVSAGAAPSTQSDFAKIVCVSQQFNGQVFDLTKAEMVIGRTDENDIAIDHRSISRHHAKITRQQADRFVISDLQSANGTLVNGEEYAQADLKAGDVIELGHIKFRFVPPGGKLEFADQEADASKARDVTDIIKYTARATQPDFIVRLQRSPRLVAIVVGAAVLVGVGAGRWVMLERQASNKLAAQVVMGATPAEIDETDVEKLVAKAQAAMEQKQWTSARALLQAAIALDSNHATAAQLLARVENESKLQLVFEEATALSGRRHFAEALAALKQIPADSAYAAPSRGLAQQAKNSLMQEKIAHAHEALSNRQWDDAQAYIDEAAIVEPTSAALAELRAALKAAKTSPAPAPDTAAATHRPVPAPPPPKPRPAVVAPKEVAPKPVEVGEDPKELYMDGTRALTGGDIEGAIDFFNRCVSADKSFALCYRALGIAYARSGNGAKAARSYKQYLKADPEARDAAQVRELLQKYESQ